MHSLYGTVLVLLLLFIMTASLLFRGIEVIDTWPLRISEKEVVLDAQDATPVVDAAGAGAGAGAADPSSFHPSIARIDEAISKGHTVLVLRSALILAAGYLVGVICMPLLDVFRLFDDRLGQGTSTAFDPILVASLLRLELQARMEASDLTKLIGAPTCWTYMVWHEGAKSVVVSRGRAIHVERLRPEPRMALLHGFISVEEAEHIMGLAKSSGLLHPSRVVNHDAEGGLAVVSSARTSESCKLCVLNRSIL